MRSDLPLVVIEINAICCLRDLVRERVSVEQVLEHLVGDAEIGELPRTSGCTPQDFVLLFDRIHAEEPEAHILYLAYSACTTCSFESALVAAKGRDYVTAIDTKSVSAGQGLVVTNVARFLQENPDAELSEEVQAFAVERMRAAGFEEIEWVNTGCVISSHCGPGSFGIASFSAE